MIAIYTQSEIAGRLELHSRHTMGDIGVGAAADCAIRIVGGVYPHHCKLLVRGAGCFIVDTCGETLVNGRSIKGPRALYRDDVVHVGLHVLFVEYTPGPPHPVAASLLDEILGGDVASREVYADWLEEQGDPRRAEFLRLQEHLLGLSPGGTAHTVCARRLHELAMVIDLDWRVLVGRTPVERCNQACEKTWAELAPTETLLRRRCGDCKQLVAYCESLPGEVTSARVVIDPSVRRVPGDLDPSR